MVQKLIWLTNLNLPIVARFFMFFPDLLHVVIPCLIVKSPSTNAPVPDPIPLRTAFDARALGAECTMSRCLHQHLKIGYEKNWMAFRRFQFCGIRHQIPALSFFRKGHYETIAEQNFEITQFLSSAGA